MMTERPDPDALLAALQRHDARQQRGKLRIFFGMAAGVGKTYAMLEAAHQVKAQGVDVVVGYVETHRRVETDTLLVGLEVIPRRVVEYRGTRLEEMDLDAILARQPQIVLVDELAHTNAPESRHLKRYQDVLEILEANITVWTTINVQHFASRADAVHQITGIPVHETVPDSLLDIADDIELIDLTPEELRKRLGEGKVYTAERVEVAANNFFRLGNLTALREMALRLTAEHVDHKLQDYMQLKHIAGPWKSGERLMVAVGPSPFAEKLIRWTRRMAYNLEAPWLAVSVETPTELDSTAKAQLARNVSLARTLGAQVIMTAESDVAAALVRLAHQHNVTQIVIGKSQHSAWQRLLAGGSLMERIVRQSRDIDVYVVSADDSEPSSASRLWPPTLDTHSRPQHYVLALVLVTLVTTVNLLLANTQPWFEYQAVGLLELLVVLVIAAYIGRGPALMAAALSAVSWNFLFIEPRFTFIIGEARDIILFVLYFAIAIFTGNLTARIQLQARQARRHADRSMALYSLAREMATATSVEDVLQTAVTQLARVFDADVAILLPLPGETRLAVHRCSTLRVDDKDQGVAQWVFDHKKLAGRFTNTLTLANAQYHPLLTPSRTVGVLGFATRNQQRLSVEQEILLETFASQIALVIERELLDDAASQAAMLRQSEQLYTTLLNSISHELRTPIATLMGAAGTLNNPETAANAHMRHELTGDILSAAQRLNRLVENLLDMSRLESGRLEIKRDWCDVSDLVSAAVRQFGACASTHPLTVLVEPDLPLLQLDFGLIEQALTNLLDNACAYTPHGTSVELSARRSGEHVELVVSDQGPGIPTTLLSRIFEKFYRVPGSRTGGTGLGLSISRGLVEAHGGALIGEAIPTGGMRFRIQLPINAPPPPPHEAVNV